MLAWPSVVFTPNKRVQLSILLVLLSVLSRAGHYERQGPNNPSGGMVYHDGGSYGYGGSQNYGGGEAEVESIQCFGKITTTYTWVRDKIPGTSTDDPLDNPPEEVILGEYCLASAQSFSALGDAYAASDNVHGFEANVGGDSIFCWSDKEGTLYTVLEGAQEELVVEFEPWAEASSSTGEATAYLYYRSWIIVPHVETQGVTRFNSPETLKFLTGQRVSSSVVLKRDGETTTELEIKSNLWSVEYGPGSTSAGLEVFKDYVASNSEGRRDPHIETDFDNATFTFYTAGSGSAKTVNELTIALPENPPPKTRIEETSSELKVKSRSILSVKPSVLALTTLVAKTTPQAPIVINQLWFCYGNPQVLSGQQPYYEGIEWKSVSVTVPAPFTPGGSACFVQLITADRHRYRHLAQGSSSPDHFDYVFADYLDVAFPYPFPPPGQWSLPGSGGFSDSPVMDLTWMPGPPDTGGNNWYQVKAEDSFETWLMFKPPAVQGQPTVWVPMKFFTWTWNGVADKSSSTNNWSVTSGTGSATQPTNTTTHPEWQHRSTGN